MGPSVPHPASAGKFAVWFHRKDYLSYFFFVAAIQTEFKVLKHENIIYFSDPDCEGHRCEGNGGYEHPPYDGEESQDEDSCSEHSSSTSTSTNQKEGKYCDCCYCEFFGHGGVRHACLCKHIDLRLTSCWCFFFFFFFAFVVVVVFSKWFIYFYFPPPYPHWLRHPLFYSQPPAAPTSRNYAEMREKLRLRLTKRKEEQPKREEQQPVIERDGGVEDHRRVEDLLQFINSADSKPASSSKAAKRARHKQKKVTTCWSGQRPFWNEPLS